MRENIKLVLGGAAILALFLFQPIYQHATSEFISITVKDKESKTVTSGDKVKSKYLVYTEGEVFENTDALFSGKFNSSDVNGVLERGKMYKVKVYGWRIPFFSQYRNIVKIVD